MKRVILSIIYSAILNCGFSQCPEDAGPDRIVCSNNSGSPTAVTIGPYDPDPGLTYSWSPASGLSNSHIANPNALPSATTTYTLTVTGGSCGTLHFTVTVKVAGFINVTSPNGSIVHPLNYIDIYYQYEGSNSVLLHTEDPNAEWCVYPDYYENGNIPIGTGTTYTHNFTGSGTNDITFFVISHDDQNNECSYTDVKTITTYGCTADNQYPVTINHIYYSYGACGPTLPATITQPSRGTGATYEWALYGGNNNHWSIASPSGNTATLNNSGGTPPVPEGIYTRASGIDYYNEIWMSWGVGIFTQSNCTPRTFPSQILPESNNSKPELFPNPATDQIMISSRDLIQKIQIYNSSGEIVKTVEVNKRNSINIQTGDLKSGFYGCRIATDKGVEVLKLIILR